MFPKLNVKSSAVILCRLTQAQKFNVVGLRLKSTLLLIAGGVCMNTHGFVFACSLLVGGFFYPKISVFFS